MNLSDYQFSWNEELNLPQASGRQRDDVITGFLQSDLQGDINLCDRVIKRIKSGAAIEITGNTTSITQNKEMIVLASLFDNTTTRCSLAAKDFLALLEGWKSFLLSR